jgi:hypothetical protein
MKDQNLNTEETQNNEYSATEEVISETTEMTTSAKVLTAGAIAIGVAAIGLGIWAWRRSQGETTETPAEAIEMAGASVAAIVDAAKEELSDAAVEAIVVAEAEAQS